jgi:hypothetical protein
LIISFPEAAGSLIGTDRSSALLRPLRQESGLAWENPLGIVVMRTTTDHSSEAVQSDRLHLKFEPQSNVDAMLIGAMIMTVSCTARIWIFQLASF